MTLVLGTPEKDNWIKVLFGGGKTSSQKERPAPFRITLKADTKEKDGYN